MPGFCKNVKKRPHITERNIINGDGCYDNYNYINLRDHCTNIWYKRNIGIKLQILLIPNIGVASLKIPE